MTDTPLPDHVHYPVSKASLTRKVGPLPMWAWVAIPAGAYVAYRYWEAYRSNGSSTAAVDTSNVGAPVSNDGDIGSGSIGTGNAGGGIVTTTGGVVTTGPASATTNAQWASLVVEALIASGVNAIQATNAISDYLAGKQLTAQEAAIVSQALTTYGAPPEGLLPVNQVPLPSAPAPAPAPAKTTTSAKPVSKPAAKPVVKTSTTAKASKPTTKTYTVKSGDNLFDIAKRFYGNGNDYMKIYNANKSKIGPDPSLIHPGLVLTIPRLTRGS